MKTDTKTWPLINLTLTVFPVIASVHNFGNPDPHQSDELDPDPHQFTDDKPKCIDYEPV